MKSFWVFKTFLSTLRARGLQHRLGNVGSSILKPNMKNLEFRELNENWSLEEFGSQFMNSNRILLVLSTFVLKKYIFVFCNWSGLARRDCGTNGRCCSCGATLRLKTPSWFLTVSARARPNCPMTRLLTIFMTIVDCFTFSNQNQVLKF